MKPFNALFVLVLGILFNYLLDYFEIRSLAVYLSGLGVIVCFCLAKKTIIKTISYLIFLIIVLLVRDNGGGLISNGDYLKKWLPILFTNKTVFLNVFGNFFLFFPFGYLISEHFKKTEAIVIILMCVFFLETIQLLAHKGVFDSLDILLNVLGGILGIIMNFLKELLIWAKRKIE